MKRAILAAAAILAATFAASPAAAQLAPTYNSFNTFTGVQGAGNFFYGEVALGDLDSPTFYEANTNCFISGALCLQRAANFDVPGWTKSTKTSFQYGTVNVPDDRLLAHPGDDNLLTFITFVAPEAGFYRVLSNFNVQDISPTGVGISLLLNNWGSPQVSKVNSIGKANPWYEYKGVFYLEQGDFVGFGLDRGGTNQFDYYNDSTGVNFIVIPGMVPEPATWALMILGIGLFGWSLRRRGAQTPALA